MAIDRTNIENIYPLTPLQAGMYFHSESQRSSGAYFEQWSLRVGGDIRPELVRDTWNDLFARHEVFRSVFTPGDGRHPLQIILRRRDVELAVADLSQLSRDEQRTELSRARERDRARGFDLAADPLVRVLLVRLAGDEWELIWSHHHIVLDGWSAAIVAAEFLAIYAARRAGVEPSLPPARPFREFVTSLPATTDTAFWRDYLADYDTVADLPRAATAHPPALNRDLLELSPALSARVDAWCRAEAITLGTFVQALWGIVLARYSYSDDVVFGYVMSGRDAGLPGVERMVGLLINTLPVRITLREDETFRDLVTRVQARAADLAAHQHTPLIDIQRASTAGDALVTHVVAIENFPSGDAAPADTGFEIVSAVSDDRTHYGLDLVVLPDRDHLRFRLSWDPSKYGDDAMRGIAGQLAHVIEQVVDNPAVRPCAMNILPPDQWDAAVVRPNQTGAAYPADASIVSLFEAQAARAPEAPALIAPHESDRWMTYGELDAAANRIAAHLVADLRIPARSRVAVSLLPSTASVAAILGVLKAGCTYVPIDPRYPRERVDFILGDSQAAAVLTGDDVQPMLPGAPERPGPRSGGRAALSGPPEPTPDDVAYVIYTSGSTGTPKGCEVTHRNVVRLMTNDRHDFTFGPSDVWVMAHSLSFDFSVWEIYGALLHGGRLVIPSREIVQDVPAFRALLASHRVTVLNQTPLAFSNLIAAEAGAPAHALDEHLRFVVFGGDRLDPAALQPWLRYYDTDAIALVNMYGITETTVHVTFCRLTREEIESPGHDSPIGRPIPETTVYVCDRHLNPQPIGAPGEMLVGGTGVARGYLNRRELTAERFVADGFSGRGRLYRSGDLAVRAASGALRFIGRNDAQLKIRGHRIEPAEIEAALLALDGVQQAVVVAEPGASGAELVACVTGRVDADTLRVALSARLPEYMVPAHFVIGDSLPLTAHGKLDREAIRARRRDGAAPHDAPFVAAEAGREQLLAEIWTAVLGVARVGRHDRFLSLGGDSIKSILILARLRARGFDLALKHLFSYPTVAELAPRLTERRATAAAPETGAPFALTPIQQRFFDEPAAGREHFNHALLLLCARSIDAAVLAQSLQALADAHGALRLRFDQADDGTWRQRVAPKGTPVPLHVADLTGETNATAALYRLSEREQTGMDLSAGPLFRAALYRMRDGDRLLLAAHHLVVDGVTWRFLIEDLAALLTRSAAPVSTASFHQWSRALHDPGRHRQLASELTLWRRMEDGDDLPIEPGVYGDAREELLEWTAAETAELVRDANAAYNTNAGELLLAAVARALGRWSGRSQMLVALESHGRHEVAGIDVSRTAGWLTALYPFVLNLSDRPAGSRIRQLKEDLRRIPGGGAGYGILRYLSGAAGAGDLRARPCVSFNYLGELGGEEPGGLFSPCFDPLWPSVSPARPRPFALEIAAIVINGRLRLSLTYAAGERGENAAREMRRLRAAVDEELRVVVRHCAGRAVPELTPADLTHKDLSLAELEGLFDED